jgi:hypothetical protein
LSHQSKERVSSSSTSCRKIERHPVESPNTSAHTAAARAEGCGGMTTTGRLASASQQGTVTGANLNKTTAPAVAGQGGDGYSQGVQRNQVTVGRGGHVGRTAGQLLISASHSGQSIAANLNRTVEDVAAKNAAAKQDGPAARAAGNTGGPTIQHGTRLVRASTAFMHDKCVEEPVFPQQKFASLHGDLDFSNNLQSICQTRQQHSTQPQRKLRGWWETSKLSVHKAMKTHRNNVIKTIRNIVQGKAGSGR